jgi:hypothetical protein
MARGNWFAFVVAMAIAAEVPADDAARKVVERAIKAHGGSDKLDKLRVMRWKAAGVTTVYTDRGETPFTIEVWRQWPRQMKTIQTCDPKGKKTVQTTTIDGDAGWHSFGDDAGIHTQGVGDFTQEDVQSEKENIYAENLDRLAFLDDKAIDVQGIGAARVQGRKATGIVVKSKGRPEIKLYFDDESGLLVKRETPVVYEDSKKTVVVETYYDDFRPEAGVVHWHRMTAFRDGKKFTELKLTEVEFLRRIDKSVFAKPKRRLGEPSIGRGTTPQTP